MRGKQRQESGTPRRWWTISRGFAATHQSRVWADAASAFAGEQPPRGKVSWQRAGAFPAGTVSRIFHTLRFWKDFVICRCHGSGRGVGSRKHVNWPTCRDDTSRDSSAEILLLNDRSVHYSAVNRAQRETVAFMDQRAAAESEVNWSWVQIHHKPVSEGEAHGTVRQGGNWCGCVFLCLYLCEDHGKRRH